MHIKTASFTFSLKVLEPLILPSYKGSTLRGGFGYAFKKVVCAIKTRDCMECLLKEKCVYSYVFETPPPSDTKIMRKYTAAPHPFIIEPPLENKRRYDAGDEINFGLILVGKAVDYLPYFIYTFDELGKMGIGRDRGRYELKEVKSKNLKAKNEWTTIYSYDTKTLKPFESFSLPIFLESEPPTPSSELLTLRFISPTRLRFNGEMTFDLEFHVLIRQLLRRISLISYFHCDFDTSEWNFKEIIEKAKEVRVKEQNLKWFDWERFSTRQNTEMKMGGFVGEVTFEGDIEPFMPLVRVGEVLHLGKGTSFGLGKYEITSEASN